MRVALLLSLVLLAGCSQDPTAPGASDSSVELAVASVDVRPGVARIVWSVREGVSGTFLVQRRLEGAPWKGLAHVPVDGESRLTLEDASIQPGAGYGYRVRIAVEPVPVYSGDVTIEVPAQ